MKEQFNQIIKDVVKPLLSANGFKKKALYFYRQKNDLICMINFQKSNRNYAGHTRFYINCGISSLAIDRALGKPEQTEPKDCYRSMRIEDITSLSGSYDIAEDTDIEALSNRLSSDLNKLIGFFNTINTTASLVNLMVDKNGLHCYQELVEYLLVTNDNEKLSTYITGLHTRFGAENRWSIFENKMNDIFRRHGSPNTVNSLTGK